MENLMPVLGEKETFKTSHTGCHSYMVFSILEIYDCVISCSASTLTAASNKKASIDELVKSQNSQILVS
jgi:hypothetical protein